MIPIIIVIISLFLDGILTNFLPYLVNDLSLFTPLLTVVSIFIICPFYRKQDKKYYKIVFLIGIIYDLFYTNLLFFNAILFLIIAFILRYIYKHYEVSWFSIILYIALIIFTYETLTGTIIFIFQLVPITIDKIIYKISHSLLLNIIYIEIVYLILKLIPKKYKKISIN